MLFTTEQAGICWVGILKDNIHRSCQMANSNNDENYQYINQETAYMFRINDQYRAWTLDKRHRRTVHKQTLTLHAAYQWELQWRISMEFQWKYYNETDSGYGTHKMIWKRQWRELKLKLKSEGNENSMGSRSKTVGYIGTLSRSFIWMKSIREIQTRIWQGFGEWKE